MGGRKKHIQGSVHREPWGQFSLDKLAFLEGSALMKPSGEFSGVLTVPTGESIHFPITGGQSLRITGTITVNGHLVVYEI